MTSEDVKKTGTTTLGMVCKDGVVIATEKRATMGTLIAHKATKKLYKIDNHMALATAGLVGDLQVLARYLSAEANLYRLKRETNMPIGSAATLMSNILNQRKFYPYYVQLIIGGYDNTGGHIYSLDAAGGAIPDKYTAGGSGSPYVFGVMEDLYRDDITTNEGVDIAIRAITAAMNRDSASGGMIDIAVITKDGYREIPEEEVKKRMEKIAK
ncbi:MAG: archaeal proteasome endopeptidase complex subunit beta [Candidatus Thermoplasmatota archaeon]|jgi:proteasome beta subunit|nr:archaeal proteasome endopeptidase complex subunit beta [Candidatus Thermoplasmatota archaeon]